MRSLCDNHLLGPLMDVVLHIESLPGSEGRVFAGPTWELPGDGVLTKDLLKVIDP